MTETTVTEDGTCLSCGQGLESIELAPECQANLLAALRAQLAGGAATKRHLAAFDAWLLSAGPSDVVVDVLNITHYESPAFDVHLLDAVVEHYRRLDKRLLLVGRRHLLIHKDPKSRAAQRSLRRYHEDGEGRGHCCGGCLLVYMSVSLIVRRERNGGVEVERGTGGEGKDHLKPPCVSCVASWRLFLNGRHFYWQVPTSTFIPAQIFLTLGLGLWGRIIVHF